MRKALQIFGILVLLFLIYLSGVILHGAWTDYQPPAVLQIFPDQSAPITSIEDSILTFSIWNIGYGGLGAETDFFYHGSGFWLAGDQMVHPPRALAQKYLDGIQQYLDEEPKDFFLLQEVDFNSDRSYGVDQYAKLAAVHADYAASKATNFKVRRVPAPALQPWKAYGRCYSGLATFSKYQPQQVQRLQLPGSFSYPNKPFMLDRCLQVSRFPFGTKELVVVNVHNTAYEKDGAQKLQQLDFLRELILPEYEKGNYVIAGGDWNQCPPAVARDLFMPNNISGLENTSIPADQFPGGWQWAYDERTPTNRSNRTVYQAGETFVTLIDFYLLSPNIELMSVKGIDMQFAFSDHQPVELQVRLK